MRHPGELLTVLHTSTDARIRMELGRLWGLDSLCLCLRILAQQVGSLHSHGPPLRADSRVHSAVHNILMRAAVAAGTAGHSTRPYFLAVGSCSTSLKFDGLDSHM